MTNSAIKKGYFAINPVQLDLAKRQQNRDAITTLNTLDRLHDVISRLLHRNYEVIDFHSFPDKKPVVNIKHCADVSVFESAGIVRRPGGVKGREQVMATTVRGVQVQWVIRGGGHEAH